jgi:hypothetical protein
LNGILVSDSDFINIGATILNKPSHSPTIKVNIQNAEDAYKIVLAEAGSSLKWDKTDLRVIGQLKTLGKEGRIINSEMDVGGQDLFSKKSDIKDSDKDGMPNDWELINKLNPNNPDDRNGDINNNNYTNLEDYLNNLPLIKNQ